jgi:carbohydrate-binding DOMON domain-containing protein
MTSNPKNHPSASRFLDGVRLSLSVLMTAALLSACTTVQQVQSADIPQLASLVQAGDTVTCTLRDGSTTTVQVTTIEHDALVGANQRVLIADITSAEIKRPDTTKSVLLGLAVVAGVAAAASGGGGGGGGGGY